MVLHGYQLAEINKTMLSICNRFDFSQVIIGVYQSTSNKGFKGEKLSFCSLSIPVVKKGNIFGKVNSIGIEKF